MNVCLLQNASRFTYLVNLFMRLLQIQNVSGASFDSMWMRSIWMEIRMSTSGETLETSHNYSISNEKYEVLEEEEFYSSMEGKYSICDKVVLYLSVFVGKK